MKIRSYVLQIAITSGGVRKVYRLRPLAAEQIPNPFVAGFGLVGISDDPQPLYSVMVAADGVVNCTCPGWQHRETCKHADAFKAAGLLPVAQVKLLAERSRLIDQAEAALKAAQAQAAASLADAQSIAEEAASAQGVYQHDLAAWQERSALLEADLAEVSAHALQLQNGLAAISPKRRRSRKVLQAAA